MNGEVIIGVDLNTKKFDKQIDYVEKRMEEIEYLLKQADLGYEVGDTAKLEAEYERLSNQLITLNERKQKAFADSELVKNFNSGIQTTNDKIKELDNSLDNVSQKKDFSAINQQINSIGNGIENATKKVAKWALTLFGIRSAYNFIRNSVGTLSQYDEQIGVNVEYIRYLLASTLQPVIENLIQLAYKLLAYVNYIAKAWFGVNLFANASTEAFQKQNKALGGSVKKAKELQKTLTGFDEMNVLQDNGDVGSGGGGGGVSLPSFPSMEDVPIPSWLQWIVDNKDLVIAGLSGIAVGLTALKLGFKGVQALGIGAIVMGIINLISDIIDFINDPSWQNFAAILGDIATVIGGIMLVMGNWWGLLVVLVGLAVKLIAENWDAIKEILGKIGGWIYDHIIKPVGDFFKGLWDRIKTDVANSIETVKSKFNSLISFFSGLISKITGFFKTIGTAVGNVIGGAFKGVINGVLSAIENILNFPIRSINNLIGVINKVPGIDLGYLSTFSLPRLAKGGILNQPGRGVNVGGAIAGEAGKEFYMPLENEQMLSMVGEAIGRYITINANITNTMNGRVISRELQKIQNRDNFLYNR